MGYLEPRGACPAAFQGAHNGYLLIRTVTCQSYPDLGYSGASSAFLARCIKSASNSCEYSQASWTRIDGSKPRFEVFVFKRERNGLMTGRCHALTSLPKNLDPVQMSSSLCHHRQGIRTTGTVSPKAFVRSSYVLKEMSCKIWEPCHNQDHRGEDVGKPKPQAGLCGMDCAALRLHGYVC